MKFSPKQSTNCAARISVILRKDGVDYKTIYNKRQPETGYIDLTESTNREYEFQLSYNSNQDSDGDVKYSDLPKGTYSLILKLESENIMDDYTYVEQILGEYSYSWTPDYQKKVVIGENGLLAAYDYESYFVVENSEEAQIIRAAGLPTYNENMKKGTLCLGDTEINKGLFKQLLVKV